MACPSRCVPPVTPNKPVLLPKRWCSIGVRVTTSLNQNVPSVILNSSPNLKAVATGVLNMAYPSRFVLFATLIFSHLKLLNPAWFVSNRSPSLCELTGEPFLLFEPAPVDMRNQVRPEHFEILSQPLIKIGQVPLGDQQRGRPVESTRQPAGVTPAP